MLLLIIITILLFKIFLQIQLQYDSRKTEDINLTLLWLDPLIKAFVTIEDTKIILNLYLLRKLILKRTLKRDKQKNIELKYLRLSQPKDVHVHVNYGFHDPFTTGIAWGIINLASEFVNIDYLDQAPNFLADNDYIYLHATANVNVGSTLLKMIR